MFWDKTNSARIDAAMAEILTIKRDMNELKLDLQLYVKNLKASKKLKTVKEELVEEEEQISKDLYGGMFLPEDGKSNSTARFTTRR